MMCLETVIEAYRIPLKEDGGCSVVACCLLGVGEAKVSAEANNGVHCQRVPAQRQSGVELNAPPQPQLPAATQHPGRWERVPSPTRSAPCDRAERSRCSFQVHFGFKSVMYLDFELKSQSNTIHFPQFEVQNILSVVQ